MSTYQQQLLKEKVRFEALFQYASVGILVVNEQAQIIMANAHLIGQFGYQSLDQLAGKKIEVLIPGRFHHSHESHRNGYMAAPKQRPMGLGYDLFGLKQDGTEFSIEISLSNYEEDGQRFVIAFVNDISKRKVIEAAVATQQQELTISKQRIEQFNAELEQQVQLRTKQLQETLSQLEINKEELTKALSKEKELSDLKSRFVSMASHEFRTPLSTILSSASLVSKYVQTTEQDKREKHIHRIKSAVNNLTDILNDFLSLGKMEDGKIIAHLQQFDMPELINTLCSEIKSITKQHQQIAYQHQGENQVVLDPLLLKNVLINLLSNAIKFSPEDAVINIATKVEETGISLQVADQGMGISAEDQRHLFERFFRGANVINIQGTGLGLHIVEKYVELMQGTIQCSSELEKGTTFNIRFPLHTLES